MEPYVEAAAGSEVAPAPMDAARPITTVPSIEELGSGDAHEVSMEELFGEADPRALSELEAPTVTGPSAFAAAALWGPRADPESSSGGGLGGDPARSSGWRPGSIPRRAPRGT